MNRRTIKRLENWIAPVRTFLKPIKLILTLLIAIACVQQPLKAQTATNVIYPSFERGTFMKQWYLLGPIPALPAAEASAPDQAKEKEVFNKDFLAEFGSESQIEPKAGLKHNIGGKQYEWKRIHSKTDSISFDRELAKKNHALAYAWADIYVPEATPALIGLGSDDAVKLWLNGKLVHEHWGGRGVVEDDDIVPADLQKGRNRILVKVQNWTMGWGFTFRFIDKKALVAKMVESALDGDVDSIQKLVGRAQDINARGLYGLTPFQAARISGYEEIATFLLSKGANASLEFPAPEQLTDNLFREITSTNTSGAAVLVAKDGKVLFEKGYGMADAKEKVVITPDTKFRIGSITKQFTAAAILKLQEQGKLRLEDKLSKFFPDFPQGDEVTVEQLLTHTSGIRSYTGKPSFINNVTNTISSDELINSIKKDGYEFSPGEKWNYNNSGYFLLGVIIEKVSGLTYGNYLKEEFFEPLGMSNTGVHRRGLALSHEAKGHSFEDGKLDAAVDWDMSWAGGAGALYSTVGDLYRWNEGIFNGKVLKEGTLKAAFTPVTTKADWDDPTPKEEGYGYGWAINRSRGATSINHGGGLHGFMSFLLRIPEQRFTVIVLANAAPPPPKLNPSELASMVSEFYLWKDLKARDTTPVANVDPKTYDDYLGRYDYGLGILTVTRDGNRLFAQLTGQQKLEIFPKRDDEFFWKVVEAKVRFVRDSEGKVDKAIHHQGGGTITAPKLASIKEIALSPEKLDAFVGKYDYGEGQAILTVTKENNRLFAQLTGQPKFEIFPKSENEFFWKVVHAEVTFMRNDQGKVTKGIHKQAGQTFEAPKIE